MYTAVFQMPTRIEDESQLRKSFGTDRLSLELSASVVFEGVITLGSEVVFSGGSYLRDGVSVGNGCILTNVELGIDNKIRPYSVLNNVKAGARNLFGPFCFIRDECIVANDCILGSHVETARSIFSSGVKISHHAFVGDANIGERTIIGAGVVFCNYDGSIRQAISIGADVILGSGVLLVAPLSIGSDSIIAAGSTITKDVLSGSKIIQKRY